MSGQSPGEFTRVGLCLLVSNTEPFLAAFTTELHSRYHDNSYYRHCPSLVQIYHILLIADPKHKQASTQTLKIFDLPELS